MSCDDVHRRLHSRVNEKKEVRGLTTGTAFRRLVAQISHCSSATKWKQVALHCSFHCQPEKGRIASDTPFESQLRASGLATMCTVLPRCSKILASAVMKTAYSSASSCVWADEEGRCGTIEQHGGGEPGDPLMPLLLFIQSGDT